MIISTHQSCVGVGEQIHQKMHRPHVEALVMQGKSLLQVLVIYNPTAVAINSLEASHHAWICPWWDVDWIGCAKGLPYPLA